MPLGAGVPFAARKKGFRRFYTQGCRDFCTAFAISLQGFRRFCVERSAFVGLAGSLWAVTVVITTIIVTLVTIQAQ